MICGGVTGKVRGRCNGVGIREGARGDMIWSQVGEGRCDGGESDGGLVIGFRNEALGGVLKLTDY